MAYLIRQRKTWYEIDGKRVPRGTPGAARRAAKSRLWYGVGIPGQPPKKRIPLAQDRETAKRMLADLVRAAERGETWVPDRAAAKAPLADHLAAFADDMRLGLGSKRRPSEKHVGDVVQRVRDCLAACRFRQLSDLNAAALARYLDGRLRLPRRNGGGGGISAQTATFILAAMRRFVRWLQSQRLPVSPLVFDSIPGFDPKSNRRHARREISPDELARLIDATRASTSRWRGLSGTDRAMLYLVAFSSGFRAGELSTLLPESFDLESSRVSLTAAAAKNRKAACQPLPPGLIGQLREYLPAKKPGRPVWPGTWPEKSAKMLGRDLAAAGVPYVAQTIDGKRYADFHALRHSYLSALAAAGVGPKELQELARHSDPSLTLGVYTHARPAALADAASRLPIPGVTEDNPLASLSRAELEARIRSLEAQLGAGGGVSRGVSEKGESS